MKKLTQAYDYAERLHAGQRRKGAVGVPGVAHVSDVAARVAASPLADEALGVAALLQDIVEDGTGSARDIAARSGACRGIDAVLEAGVDRAMVRARVVFGVGGGGGGVLRVDAGVRG